MKRGTENAKTIEKLVAQYSEAAQRHGAATEEGDYRTANAAHKKILSAADAMRHRKEDGERALLGLLSAESPFVRRWAAFHLLSSHPVLAEAELERLAKGPRSFLRLGAETTLEEWRAGRLKPE